MVRRDTIWGVAGPFLSFKQPNFLPLKVSNAYFTVVAGVTLTVLLIDKASRRVLMVPPPWLCMVFLAIIGLWVDAPPVVVLFLAFSFFNAGYNTLTSIYPSGVFPTEVCGIGTGLAAAFSRIGAGLGTSLLPWFMTNFGTSTSMLIAAGIATVGAGLSQSSETKGKSLNETAAGYSHEANPQPAALRRGCQWAGLFFV